MITNARLGGGTSRTGMPGSAATGASASRAVAIAAAMSTTDTTPTQRRWCRANTTSTAIGAAITTANAIHLTTPRWARNQYAPPTTRHAPMAPTTTMATLAGPAKAIMTTAAASRSTKADRASQRRCVIALSSWWPPAVHAEFPRFRPRLDHPPGVNHQPGHHASGGLGGPRRM